MSFSTCGNCGAVISLSPCKCNQSKTLTDEEILDIWYAMEDGSNEWTRYVTFANAILKKASEK